MHLCLCCTAGKSLGIGYYCSPGVTSSQMRSGSRGVCTRYSQVAVTSPALWQESNGGLICTMLPVQVRDKRLAKRLFLCVAFSGRWQKNRWRACMGHSPAQVASCFYELCWARGICTRLKYSSASALIVVCVACSNCLVAWNAWFMPSCASVW